MANATIHTPATLIDAYEAGRMTRPELLDHLLEWRKAAPATPETSDARAKAFAPADEREAYKTAHAAIEFGEKLSPLVDSVRAVVGAIEYGDLLGEVPVIPERYLIAADLLRLLKFQADTLHGEQLLVWDDAANAVDVLAGVLECGADVGAGQ